MNKWLTTKKQGILVKYSSVIREKAIERAKVEIALAGKRITDYDEDQLEVIVKDQEDKILSKYRNASFAILLLIFGIY